MALVLSRKVNEGVRIFNDSPEPLIIQPGEEIARLALARVSGDKVRLAFEAPQALKILRDELADAAKLIKHPLPDTLKNVSSS